MPDQVRHDSRRESDMKRQIFALIDCNNFFVSCERIFRPDLEGKPVVVFSSNDGVIVARSNEAKALGIPMGAPVFKYRELLKAHNVVQFSGNFDLYADISRRITSVLTSVTPRTEVYSIDESFLDLSQLAISDYTAWGRQLRESILKWIGVPVSIGIAPTKTLAKLAADRAKLDVRRSTIDDRRSSPNVQRQSSNVQTGVLNLIGQPSSSVDTILETTPVESVWGIGWRLSPKMRAAGMPDALSLSLLQPRRAQQLMGIKGRQLVAELNGISCYPLELEHQKPKSIARTRTFGSDTRSLGVLESAIASFTASAAFRLRRSQQLTRRASLFITTNRNKPGYRKLSREIVYRTPTADTGRLTADLTALLTQIYRPGLDYHRAGVLLYDFAPAGQLQTDLLGTVNISAHDKSQSRMQAIDHLNERHGKRTIHYATEDLQASWQPHRKDRSPRYTTHPNELSQAKIHPKPKQITCITS